MLGEGVRDEVVVVVTMGLDGAVATDQLIARLAVDLDGLCCVLGTQLIFLGVTIFEAVS